MLDNFVEVVEQDYWSVVFRFGGVFSWLAVEKRREIATAIFVVISKCLISSTKMLSSPAALPFFMLLITTFSSSSERGWMKVGTQEGSRRSASAFSFQHVCRLSIYHEMVCYLISSDVSALFAGDSTVFQVEDQVPSFTAIWSQVNCVSKLLPGSLLLWYGAQIRLFR